MYDWIEMTFLVKGLEIESNVKVLMQIKWIELNYVLFGDVFFLPLCKTLTACKMTDEICYATYCMCCLLFTALQASISSRNTKVHLVLNKSKWNAFMLYTSWHLACNLTVCWGDLWPSNDPNRRHACNCSACCNSSNDCLSMSLYTCCAKWEGLLRYYYSDWTLLGVQ